MPVLDNPKWELYAQALAKGKTATEAYAAAGYEESRSAASRLSANVNITARVAELQSRAAVRTEITIASLTEMYMSDRKFAYEVGQPAAARGCADSLAKLHGLIVERKEVGTPGSFDRMSDVELEQFIAGKMGHMPKGETLQ